QDLKPEYTEALLGAISETGTLYVLSDPMSRRGEKIEFSESVKISTDETVRVPQEIVILMNRLKLTQTPLTSASPYQGEMPSFYFYKSEASLVKHTQDAVNKAREEGFTDEQIVILSMKSVNDSVLLKSDTLGDNSRYTLKHVTAKFKNGRQVFSEGAIWHDTVRRFKGLQAPFVILTEMDFTEFDEKAAALLYLGMTRASMGLALVMSEDATKAFIDRLD
ncbi:MAG: ATP-binding domain-containing protein, partial [Sutterellaceae bacterium]|nr:ATP-binding domain-containing protein [Sutterellaceae bacterium]